MDANNRKYWTGFFLLGSLGFAIKAVLSQNWVKKAQSESCLGLIGYCDGLWCSRIPNEMSNETRVTVLRLLLGGIVLHFVTLLSYLGHTMRPIPSIACIMMVVTQITRNAINTSLVGLFDPLPQVQLFLYDAEIFFWYACVFPSAVYILEGIIELCYRSNIFYYIQWILSFVTTIFYLLAVYSFWQPESMERLPNTVYRGSASINLMVAAVASLLAFYIGLQPSR